MSYTVLARKYRPQTFADLVGQEHVSRTLGNAIQSGRVAHAFLFTGARGVGKTTTARLLAKALNCEKGPTPTPCNQCAACLEIAAGTDIDVLEIDGASNNGVDDVRRLQETLPFRPARDRFKIVIVDEVHMLSVGAFNAFLKTLEEPPSHVKFVFATTEIHKVPVTIRSRCQRYDFRLIPHTVVADRVREILAAENIQADDAAIALVAREAAGSMRDALTVLDQVLALGDSELHGDSVARGLAIASREHVLGTVEGLLTGAAADCLQRVAAVAEQGLDLLHFTRQLLECVRDLVVLKVVGADAKVALAPDEQARALHIAQAHDRAELERLFSGLTKLVEDVGQAALPQMTLEMGLVRLAGRPPLVAVQELIERFKSFEDLLGGGGPRPGGPSGPSGPSGPAGGGPGSGRPPVRRAGAPSSGYGAGAPADPGSRLQELPAAPDRGPAKLTLAAVRPEPAPAPARPELAAVRPEPGPRGAELAAPRPAVEAAARAFSEPTRLRGAELGPASASALALPDPSVQRAADLQLGPSPTHAIAELTPNPSAAPAIADPAPLRTPEPPSTPAPKIAPENGAPAAVRGLAEPGADRAADGGAGDGGARGDAGTSRGSESGSSRPGAQPAAMSGISSAAAAALRIALPQSHTSSVSSLPQPAAANAAAPQRFAPSPSPASAGRAGGADSAAEEELPPLPDEVPFYVDSGASFAAPEPGSSSAPVERRSAPPIHGGRRELAPPADHRRPASDSPAQRPTALRAVPAAAELRLGPDLDSDWARIVAQVRSALPALAAVLDHGMPLGVSASTLHIGFPDGSFFGRQAQSGSAKEAILKAAEQVLGARPNLVIGSPGGAKISTLAELEENGRQARRAQRREAALSHPAVLDAMEIFDESEASVDVHVDLE